MKLEQKNQAVFWFAIVALVIGALILITLKGRPTVTTPISQEASDQANGVKVVIVQEGSGEGAALGNTLSVNYTGMLSDGTVFDSNMDPKFNHVEPFVLVLGQGNVIPGWEAGLTGMKVGERRVLEISPDYAYGAAGYPPVIPPNATLLFQIELVDIIK